MSSQAPSAPFPSVTLGKATIEGLKLGGYPLRVQLDTESFNSLPTQVEFMAHCSKNGALRAAPFSTFLKCDANCRLHQNQSAYIVGSMVKKIEGGFLTVLRSKTTDTSLTGPHSARSSWARSSLALMFAV
jgi:hypothetical protein